MPRTDSGDAIVFLYVTFPGDYDVAGGVGGEALGRQLCACVNAWQGRSIYTWEGAVQNDAEQYALFKTTRASEPALRELIAAGHPYTVPCIAALAPELNPPFAQFVVESTGATTEQADG